MINNSSTMIADQIKNFLNDFDEVLKKAFSECGKSLNTLQDIVDKISTTGSGGNKTNYIMDNTSNLSSYLSDKSNYTVKEISNYLSTLTFEQTVAILHIFGCIVIIISLISLFIVFYGNKLIDNLNLENRFPKIARLIQLRRKFQMYYSLIDFIIIIIVTLSMLYIDILLFNL